MDKSQVITVIINIFDFIKLVNDVYEFFRILTLVLKKLKR